MGKVLLDDSLRTTLRDLVDSGTSTNPALNALIDDYTRYHVVMLVVGGLFLVALIVANIYFWRRFARSRTATGWSFERKVYLCFGTLAVMVTLFLGLVVAANLSNVVKPRTGFEGAIGLVGKPAAGSQSAELQQSFATWLSSGTAEVPAVVQGSIDERLSWQRPKAIICTVLLVAMVVLSALIWRRLIRTSRARPRSWTPGDRGLMLLGSITVVACLVLMLMVIGNTQGSVAPMALTLFYG